MSEMIYETIVVSTDEAGKHHIAPFGVRERGELILIAPFRPSTSLDNLLNQKVATLNLSDDVRVFAGALTGHRDWPVYPAKTVNGYVLESALAHRELVLVEVQENETRPELYFKVVHQETHRPFKGFNRAQAAVVELSVLVSRLHMLSMDKINAELEYLKIAMEKTAGEREWEAWSWLLARIQQYQKERQG